MLFRSVRVSPDLSIARVYLSIFPSAKAPEMIESINAQTKTIRYELAQKVRFQLRKCPELAFYIDDSLDYIDNIDNLLKKDNIPARTEDEAAGTDPPAAAE